MGVIGTLDVVALAGLEPRGTAAREIDALWWILLVSGTVALVLVLAALALGLMRRRRGDAADPSGRSGRSETSREGRTTTTWMVAGGVVLPVLSVAIVFVATIGSMRSLASEDEPDLTIEVTGHQWWWEIRYPETGVVTANEVHVPAGVPVRLELRSADVVHSFWVPELAGKIDLIPERANELVIDADRPGRYLGRCAEFCGLQHANMAVVVVAHDDAGFRHWLEEQAEPAPEPVDELARAGLDTFMSNECASCHTISGTPADGRDGPDLTHVASREFIAGGLLEPVVPDLRSWIDDPHAIKPGNLMPETELTSDELDRLVAYLETLR